MNTMEELVARFAKDHGQDLAARYRRVLLQEVPGKRTAVEELSDYLSPRYGKTLADLEKITGWDQNKLTYTLRYMCKRGMAIKQGTNPTAKYWRPKKPR